MCFGGRLYCPQCPGNKWFYDMDDIPDIHSPQWPVPLVAARGRVKIQDFAAEVTVEQRFENRESQPLEVQYEFKLDPKSSVVRFEALIDGKRVVGELKEKESAKNAYDDAIASGHGAYLLEQKEETKSFVANVGNLPPGKEVVITIVYVLELEFNEDGQLKLELLEQGYSPDGETSLTFPQPSSKDAEKNSLRVPNGLTIDIELDMSSNISQIVTPTHAAVTTIQLDESNPRRGHVSIPTTTQPLVENFQLFIQMESGNNFVTRVQKNAKGERIAMVAFFPQLNNVDPLGEIIFLIDRSGSMMGPRLTRAKEAVQIFLRSLTSGVKFNIVSFGSNFVQLFPESKEYNAETLATAAAHVKSMSANMGGTEILPPLKSIFQKVPDPKYPRQLFVLTDGEVSNPELCINACRGAADTTRTFCFGIGSGASKELVEGMANAGNGNAVMIGNNDRIDDKVLEQLSYALMPAVSNISINWSSADAKVSPSRHGPTYGGKPVITFAWINPNWSESTPVPVRFKATSPLQDFDITQQLSLKDTTEGTFLFALAARRLFEQFQNNTSFAHDPVTGKLLTGWNDEKVKQEMIRLSLDTGVLCKHTAFVAIEERTDPTQGNMVLREVLKTKTGQIQGKTVRHGLQVIGYSSGSDDEEWEDGNYRSSSPRGSGRLAPIFGSSLQSASGSGIIDRSNSMDVTTSLNTTLLLARRSAVVEADDDGSDEDGGWGDDFDDKEGSFVSKSSFQAQSEKKKSHAPQKERQQQQQQQQQQQKLSSGKSSKPGTAPRPSAASAAPAGVSDAMLTKMREVILKQTAEGTWTIADAVSLSLTADNIRKALSAIHGAPTDATAELIFATAIVCAYFDLKFAAEKKTWQLVVKKARSWIAKQKVGSVDWNAKAAEFVSAL